MRANRHSFKFYGQDLLNQLNAILFYEAQIARASLCLHEITLIMPSFTYLHVKLTMSLLQWLSI